MPRILEGVQQIGKQGETLIVHNAFAIRSAGNNDKVVDVSHLQGNKALVISNATNQQTVITVYAKNGTLYNHIQVATVTIPAYNSAAIVDGKLNFPFKEFTIRMNFVTAPTTGSVTMAIEGEY